MASDRASPMPGRVISSSLLAVLMSMTFEDFDVEAPVPVVEDGAVEPLVAGGTGLAWGVGAVGGGGVRLVVEGLVVVVWASAGTASKAPTAAMAHRRVSFMASSMSGAPRVSHHGGARERSTISTAFAMPRQRLGPMDVPYAMDSCRRRPFLAVILALAVVLWTGEGRAQRHVALELVLAIDASTSIDGNLFDFQLRGHAAAFRDARLVEAISGQGGAIAVTLVQWSDPSAFRVLIPWTDVADPAGAARFAAAIDALPRRPLHGSTGIGAAMLKAAGLFRSDGDGNGRRVIDIVSNGYNNIGITPDAARERILAQGITVNGLVILDEVPWLADYFTRHVIGGPSAFVAVADRVESFGRALLDKLIWEITEQRPAALQTAERPE